MEGLFGNHIFSGFSTIRSSVLSLREYSCIDQVLNSAHLDEEPEYNIFSDVYKHFGTLSPKPLNVFYCLLYFSH